MVSGRSAFESQGNPRARKRDKTKNEEAGGGGRREKERDPVRIAHNTDERKSQKI